jgi:phosphoglycerate dehydrogenase-like enzyme
MMTRYQTIFITQRGQRHQQAALAAAPPDLDITILRRPHHPTLTAHLAAADYLISERAGVIDAALIRAAPRLKLILRLGSLWYDIDTVAARAAGIAVCTWPLGSVIRVAEHVILQMLALAKKLGDVQAVIHNAEPEWGRSRRTTEDTFAYNWSNRQGLESLWQKTVGLVGFGEIGAELARRLAGWGCRLLYHKRRRLPPAVEMTLGLTFATFDDIFSQCDTVVNLLPYSTATNQAINAACLARMKTGAFLVSCGSGSVIDETALAAAVQSGRLAGAALDTLEWEPIRADNPLLTLARQGYNLVLTPHTAAGDTTAAAAERAAMYSTIINHIAGRPLAHQLV